MDGWSGLWKNLVVEAEKFVFEEDAKTVPQQPVTGPNTPVKKEAINSTGPKSGPDEPTHSQNTTDKIVTETTNPAAQDPKKITPPIETIGPDLETKPSEGNSAASPEQPSAVDLHPEPKSESESETEPPQPLTPEQTIALLKEELQKQKKMLQTKDQQLTHISNLSRDFKDQNTNLTKNVNDLKQSMESKDSQIIQLTKEKDNLQTQLSVKLKNLQIEIETNIATKDKQLEAAKIESSRLLEEGTNYSRQVVKLQQANTTLSSQKTELTTKLNEYMDKSQKLEKQNTELEDKNHEISNALKEIKQATGQSQTRADNNQKQISELNETVREQRAALEKAWLDLANQQKLHTTEKQEHILALQQLETNLTNQFQTKLQSVTLQFNQTEFELKETIADLRKALSGQQTEARAREEGFKTQINALLEQQQDESQRTTQKTQSKAETDRPILQQAVQLQNELTVARREHQAIRDQLQNKLNDLTTELSLGADQIQQLKTRNAELVDMHKDMHNQIKNLNKQIKDQQIKFDELITQNSKLNATISSLTLKNESVVRLHANQAQSLTNRAQHAEIALQQANQQIRQMTERLGLLEGLKSQHAGNLLHDFGELDSPPQKKANQQAVVPKEPVTPVTPPKNKTEIKTPPKADSPMPERHPIGGILGLETLHMRVKQQEQEITSLSQTIASLTKSKLDLENRLAAETAKNQVLNEQLQKHDDVSYQQLQTRYMAAVELLGEREERLEMVTNDLKELKQVYRQHINELSLQIK